MSTCPQTSPEAPEDGDTHCPPGRGPSSLSFDNEDLDARSHLASTDWTPSTSSLLCGLLSGRTQRRATRNFYGVNSISAHFLNTSMLSPACRELAIRSPALPRVGSCSGPLLLSALRGRATSCTGTATVHGHSTPPWKHATFHPGKRTARPLQVQDTYSETQLMRHAPQSL